VPAAIFNSDLTVENNLNVTGGTVFGRVDAVDQLLQDIKTIAAASADFAAFKAAIAAL
jgi:hypothetical protein